MKFLKRFNEELSPEIYRSAADKIEAGEGNDYYKSGKKKNSRKERYSDLRKHANIMESKTLLYYAFDWDDNILNMTTVIHMEHLIDGKWIPEDVSTSIFAEVRGDKKNWRILGGDPELAFSEFRDNGPRGDVAFLDDVKESISSRKFAPAWPKFIKCLTNGAIFAIITARGHEPEGMRKGIEYIIDEILDDTQKEDMYRHLLKFANLFKVPDVDSIPRILRGVASENILVKEYLDLCHLVGVSAPTRGGSPANPEASKEEALIDLIKDANNYASRIGYTAKVGFSDDDPGNVKHVIQALSKDDLNHEKLWPFVSKIVVIDTHIPHDVIETDIPTRRRSDFSDDQLVDLEGQNEGMDPLKQSVLGYTQFGNMTSKLYPKGPEGRQDDYANQLYRQEDYLKKLSKEIFGEHESKEKKRK
jgi:hypothetical protein